MHINSTTYLVDNDLQSLILFSIINHVERGYTKKQIRHKKVHFICLIHSIITLTEKYKQTFIEHICNVDREKAHLAY